MFAELEPRAAPTDHLRCCSGTSSRSRRPRYGTGVARRGLGFGYDVVDHPALAPLRDLLDPRATGGRREQVLRIGSGIRGCSFVFEQNLGDDDFAPVGSGVSVRSITSGTTTSGSTGRFGFDHVRANRRRRRNASAETRAQCRSATSARSDAGAVGGGAADRERPRPHAPRRGMTAEVVCRAGRRPWRRRGGGVAAPAARP